MNSLGLYFHHIGVGVKKVLQAVNQILHYRYIVDISFHHDIAVNQMDPPSKTQDTGGLRLSLRLPS